MFGNEARPVLSFGDTMRNTLVLDHTGRYHLACTTPKRQKGLLMRSPFGSGLFAVLGGIAAMAVSSLAPAANPAVTVNIDNNANRHAISPLIYGVASADTATLQDLNVPLNRYGGNNTSRYNWQQNADNRARDWYYESIPADSGSSTSGELGDTFINNAKSGGVQPMLTFPMLRWVAKVGANRSKLASFSIAKYGAQADADWSWFPDAGNGVRTNGSEITGNDPNDANAPNSPALQQQWAQHLVQRWGKANAGGLRYYILDNEYSIWQETHRDVQPTGAKMDEVRDLMIAYAAALKAVDPDAQIVGPEEWGWSGFKYSGYDQQYGKRNGWSNLPDQQAHGGVWYIPYLLDQLRQASASRGVRLLDVMTTHWYPQSGEFSNDVSQQMQLTRNRSTRSLWDPSYVDPTWINDTVRLVPRMKEWVNQYYPGTKTGITEYNWGAEGHINGATTQADILGIFGREGLDMAARWVIPDPATPTYKAMKIFRNYDNAGGAFGDTSVKAQVPNPDELSAFAAQRSSDGALTVLVVNKVLSGSTPVSLSLGSFTPAGNASVWQLTSSNSITCASDIAVSGTSFTATVPAQSITLFVIPRGTGGGGTLPAGWTSLDIGSPTPAGSGSESSGTYTIKGGGADISGTSDQFQFSSKDLSGDGTVTANCTAVQNTNGWAKAGVMIRNGTAANAMFAYVCITPSNGIAFQYRTTTGGSAAQAQVTGQAVPKYLRVQRSGNSFTGYYSTNGTTWTQIGTAQTIAMATAAKAGLAVTSHVQGTLNTSTFNNVSVTAGGAASYYIYQEALASDWSDWSWAQPTTSPIRRR